MSYAQAGGKPVSPMNVLFVGNSYTHMNNMPKIFEKIAQSRGVKINVEMSAKSNHSFKMHSERQELFDKINSKKWDYVILQGFSRELAQVPEYIDTASVPYIGALLDSIYAKNACTNVLFYMTWGYKNGYEEQEELNTNESMSDSVRLGYEYVSDLFGIPMVPVGPVWRDFRTNNQEIELYDQDERHPSFEGSYLIACSFYSAIFKAPPLVKYSGKSSRRKVKVLQQSAYDYVMANLDTFKLMQNTLHVEFERTKKGEYMVRCEANYPNAVSLSWDFGDGMVKTSSISSHQYKNAGSYWITLRVEDMCGVRIIKRKVRYVAPKKPSRNKKSKPQMEVGSDKKI